MDYEKRYKEALERARDYHKADKILANRDEIDVLEDIFPELKESGDEKIKKVLVDFFKSYKEQGTCGAETFNGIPTDNILDWLEKQEDHKH